MSVDALYRPVKRQEGRRGGGVTRSHSEQSQLDDILHDLLADPLFLNNSRSYEWHNDAEGTYGSISPQRGNITTHSGHGGRTVVSWQMNNVNQQSTGTPRNAAVAVTRRSGAGDRPTTMSSNYSPSYLESSAASVRPASADRSGSRYESRRVETRTEATTRREGTTSNSGSVQMSKPRAPSPPVRRRMFNADSFNHDPSSAGRSAPVPPPRRDIPPQAETVTRAPMNFQSAPSTPSTAHRNQFASSDTDDGPSPRWLGEQRGKMTNQLSAAPGSRQQKTYRPGPAAVVQSDTEDYFRPSAPDRRGTAGPRSRPDSPSSRWATNAFDDAYISDGGGISPRRQYGSQSSVQPPPHSRSADTTRTYELESGRLFETKKNFFVSGIERPADRSHQQTRYTFSVSPQRSLTGDEFPTSNRPPPRPITPSRSCTSPVLPPLRTDSSREAVMRVHASRDFVSPKPARDAQSPTLDDLEKSLRDFHSLLQAPSAPNRAPSPPIDELVTSNKSRPVESALPPPPPPEEDEEEEIISLQPIGPGVQNLEPDGPIRQRSVTPGFPGFSSETVTPVTTPSFQTSQRMTNTNQGYLSTSNTTTPTTPNAAAAAAAAATTPADDMSSLVEEFASLTQTSSLHSAPPSQSHTQRHLTETHPASPRFLDDEATLTRQTASANQNSPPAAATDNTDAEMHIYQTPRRQYSQPTQQQQVVSEQMQQTMTYQQQQSPQQQNFNLQQQQQPTQQPLGITPQQTTSNQRQQYQYQISEQSQEGFAVPYQYSPPVQQQQQVAASSHAAASYHQGLQQPVEVVEQVEQRQQYKQAFSQHTAPAQQTAVSANSVGVVVEGRGGRAAGTENQFGQQGITTQQGSSSATSVQYRSAAGGQGTSAVDGQWIHVQGQPVAVEDASRAAHQYSSNQQSSTTVSNKRSGMVLDTGAAAAAAGRATSPRTLSPSTLPAPQSAARNRSVSPSDMTLRARLQSRLESRSPGMAMMSGGQTSPSVYFGQSRNGSLTSLNDGGEVLHQSPRFVHDTSKLWHKPHITREEAIVLLKNKPPGSFVVRNSNTFQGAFGLALKVAQIPPNVHMKEGVDPQSELVRHFLIEPTSKGVRLKGCSNEPVFGSLAALVYQHTITPLALPCKLLLPEFDIAGADATDSTLTGTTNKSLLYVQGAACNVLYINSIDMESLTGPEALSRAIAATFPSTGSPPHATDVHFKVSSEGITLTDNKHRLFFRRHYPINTVTFCGVDARDRRWTLKFDDNQTMDCKVFGFVARKPGSSSTDNACHVFAEMDPNQPANAIVNFLTKVMIGQGHFMKT